MSTRNASRRQRRETPRRRTNPSGEQVWQAIWTNHVGQRKSAGTFKLKRDAQDAIDAAYEAEEQMVAGPRPQVADTVGGYFPVWLKRHPRAGRTNTTNKSRVRQTLDIEIEGVPLKDWPLRELRRRHAHDIVAHLLEVDGRAASGAQNVLRALSVMAEDAIGDDLCELNFVQGVRVRASDPRVTGETDPARVYEIEELHRFARAAGKHEPMVRTLTDCGLRLGELLGLERRDFDGQLFRLRGNAHHGVFTPGDQPTKRHVRDIPVPAPLAHLLRAMPSRIDTPVMFPTVTGRIWQESNWRRRLWAPIQKASRLDIRPKDCRHSWVTHLRAAGLDPADLADMAGHSVDVADAHYTSALRRSADAMRAVFE